MTQAKHATTERARWLAPGGLAASWRTDGTVWIRPGPLAAWVRVGHVRSSLFNALICVEAQLPAEWRIVGYVSPGAPEAKPSGQRKPAAPRNYDQRGRDERHGVMLLVGCRISRPPAAELEQRIAEYGRRAERNAPLFHPPLIVADEPAVAVATEQEENDDE